MRSRARIGIGALVVAGVLVALALAAFASPFASSRPDGLNRVAADHGLDHAARASATGDSPLAGYAVRHVDDEKVTKGLAGVIGVGITVVVATAVFGGLLFLIRRRSRTEPAAER